MTQLGELAQKKTKAAGPSVELLLGFGQEHEELSIDYGKKTQNKDKEFYPQFKKLVDDKYQS